MKFQKEMLLLYAVTDRGCAKTMTVYEQVEEALKGGATLVQLREKGLDDETHTAEARRMKELCHRYGVPLIVNDNVHIALRVGADGVHVGTEDTPVADIRSRVPKDFIIGATAKTLEQARVAERAGADYLGVGAVFPSQTKRQAIRITPQQLQEICASVSIPAVAIGGIGPENMEELAGLGMSGFAVVRALFGEEDISRAARRLREQAKRVVGGQCVSSRVLHHPGEM